MSFGHVLVRYKVSLTSGDKELVEGVQVGRFAVRTITETDISDWRPRRHKWVIDHINTGWAVASAKTFEDAMKIADDTSRYSEKDPSARNVKRLVKQIGPLVGGWLSSRMYKETDAVTLREFLTEKGG